MFWFRRHALARRLVPRQAIAVRCLGLLSCKEGEIGSTPDLDQAVVRDLGWPSEANLTGPEAARLVKVAQETANSASISVREAFTDWPVRNIVWRVTRRATTVRLKLVGESGAEVAADARSARALTALLKALMLEFFLACSGHVTLFGLPSLQCC